MNDEKRKKKTFKRLNASPEPEKNNGRNIEGPKEPHWLQRAGKT